MPIASDVSGLEPPSADDGTVAQDEMDYTPLSVLLPSYSPEKLEAVQAAAVAWTREKLINSFRAAFTSDKRGASYALAIELVRRGIPPAFWHDYRSVPKDTPDRQFDMLVHDLLWIRHAHARHLETNSRQRYINLCKKGDSGLHQDAEFLFWNGRRSAWQVVKYLSMTVAQQFECAWLRTKPVTNKCAVTAQMRERVFGVLQAAAKAAPRRSNFTDEDAGATLDRRFKLWQCSEKTDGKGAGVARMYGMMTGEKLSRAVVHRQLEIVREILRRGKRDKIEKTEML